MTVTLDERLRRIEDKRAALLSRVEPMAEEALCARLRPGKWTIQEIIEHLILAEEDVLIDFDGLNTLHAQARRFRDSISYVVVMFVLTYDIPVKAPSTAMLPTGGFCLDELRERWEENHGRLRQYLVGLDSAAARRAIFRHPVAGPLTVHQALRMLEVHLDRHTRQIQALERLYRDRGAA
jgi:hypothetical protein